MIEHKPYVGITGISTLEDAQFIAGLFAKNFSQRTHQGMAGYIITNKTFAGFYAPEKAEPLDRLLSMLEITKNSGLNAFHFRTKGQEGIVSPLTKLLNYQGIYERNLCRTIQLNLDWPKVSDLEKLKNQFPATQFILQLGCTVLHNESSVDIGIGLESYRDLIDYVILDPSEGQGIPFIASSIAPYARITRHSLPDSGIIFGGGFNDENVNPRLAELYKILRSTDFGIDAQKNLFTHSPKNYSIKILNQQKAENYIERAANFFKLPH